MTITLRSTKGSELSYSELDGNFTDLDNRTKVAWSEVTAQLNVAGLSSPADISVYKSVFQLYSFDMNGLQHITGMVHLPKNYVIGTVLYPHIHILTDAVGAAGTVRFGMDYSWANETDSHDFGIGPPYSTQQFFSAPQTIYAEHAFDGVNDVDLHITLEFPSVTLTGIEGDSIIMLNLFRDAAHINDTYPQPMHLNFVDVYYQAQGFGSVRK